MVTSLIMVLLSSFSAHPIPVHFIEEDGFGAIRQGSRQALLPYEINESAERLMLYSRKDSNESLSVSAAWMADSSQGRIFPFLPGSPRHQKVVDNLSFGGPGSEEMPSKSPLGFVRQYVGEPTFGRSLTYYCETSWAIVKVNWQPPRELDSRGNIRSTAVDLAARAAWLERLVRHTLINAAGLKSESAGNGSLAGHGVGRAKRRGSAFLLGDLGQWTSLAGWTVTEEDKFGLLHLKKGSKWAVLPLGADQVKVNGVWKEMGDSAASLNGKLYLPEAGLRHLKDGS